ncbi:MAG: hypothetical protein NTU63_03405 [Candidatus Pacearchaeota archaeon]|nr:hypothetical protein [Candidatus Pacearchaeota archaeon]
MVFKINIAEKTGKTYHLESESEEFIGKELHNKIDGKELKSDLEGYEFEITGTSDNAGFTSLEEIEGAGLKKVLLTYGKAMHKRPRKEGKKKVSNPKPKGLRMRKTIRGRVISPAIVQVNLKILKEGSKKLSEIFPEQNQKKETKEPEQAKETKEPEKIERVKEEKKEEKKKSEQIKEKKKVEEKPAETKEQ